MTVECDCGKSFLVVDPLDNLRLFELVACHGHEPAKATFHCSCGASFSLGPGTELGAEEASEKVEQFMHEHAQHSVM